MSYAEIGTLVYTSGSASTPFSDTNPEPVGVAAPGSSVAASRGNHVHAHGTQAGESLHSAVSVDSAGFITSVDKAALDRLAALPVLSKEPTGFSAPENVVINYDPTARTVALTGTFAAYWQGTVVPALTSGWTSGSHANTNGVYYLSYDGSNFNWSNSVWTFDQLQIAYVYYQGAAGNTFAVRECHGFMQWQAHEGFHETIGTYRESGGALGWAGAIPSNTSAANRRPTITSCLLHDEDVTTTNGSAAAGAYTRMNLSGSSATPVAFTTGANDIVPLNGNQPYYNLFSAATWSQAVVTSGNYTSVWLIAVPATASVQSQKFRFIWMQGQSAGNLASQTALTPSNLNLGDLRAIATEFVFIAQVIIQYTSNNWIINSAVTLTGNRYLQIGSPSGNYLTTVAVTAPITGDGTLASPLGMTQAAAITAQLTTVTHTAPGTPDYSIQDLVQNTGYGFVTKDEGNSTLSVIANLQTRVSELEARLKTLGMLA